MLPPPFRPRLASPEDSRYRKLKLQTAGSPAQKAAARTRRECRSEFRRELRFSLEQAESSSRAISTGTWSARQTIASRRRWRSPRKIRRSPPSWARPNEHQPADRVGTGHTRKLQSSLQWASSTISLWKGSPLRRARHRSDHPGPRRGADPVRGSRLDGCEHQPIHRSARASGPPTQLPSAFRSAARASRRIESRGGRSDVLVTINGISVQPSTTASQPSSLRPRITSLKYALNCGRNSPFTNSSKMIRSISSRCAELGVRCSIPAAFNLSVYRSFHQVTGTQNTSRLT